MHASKYFTNYRIIIGLTKCLAVDVGIVTIPVDIEEARRNIENPIATIETMLLMRPSIIVPIKNFDYEVDGTILSSYDAVCRVMDSEHHKSLCTDTNGNPCYTPLQGAFQR
ncbi:unnamed protein product, partial [Rotaria magnacalcarata]